MGKVTAPEGRTFQERWPDDAGTAEWLARPWIPIALGAVAGLFALPILLARVALVQSAGVLATLVGATAVLTWLLRRGGTPALVGRLWRVVMWAGLAVVIGVVSGLVTGTICGEVDRATACTARGPVSAVMVFALSVLGSILAAVGVDRAGRRIVRGRPANRA